MKNVIYAFVGLSLIGASIYLMIWQQNPFGFILTIAGAGAINEMRG